MVTAKDVKTKETITVDAVDRNNGVVAISTNDSPSDVWVKYEMPSANMLDAVDLLWGLAGKDAYKETDAANPAKTIGSDYNEDLTKQIVPERVKFLFKHALAKIGGATSDGAESLIGNPKGGVKIVADIDENSGTPTVDGQSKQGANYFPTDFNRKKTLITLKSVKIQDRKSASDDAAVPFSMTTPTSNLLTFGWFDIETGKWSEKDGTFGVDPTYGGAIYNITATYDDTDVTDNTTYSINDDIREPEETFDKKTLLDDGDAYKQWKGTGEGANNPIGVNIGTPQDVFSNENVPALLFIPTGEGTDASNQKIYVTVDYIVRTADPNLKAGYSEVEQVITNEVILNGKNLDPNKYYTLIMHLGMTSVKFEARVAEWSSNTDDLYNEDGTIIEQGDEEAEVVWLPSNVITNKFTATINQKNSEPANYFSNQENYSKDLTIQLNGADYTGGGITIDCSDATWLEQVGTTAAVKTKSANTGADNRTGKIVVNVAATETNPAFSQEIMVTQYGAPSLDITYSPTGLGEGGKLSASGQTVAVSAKLRGKEIVLPSTAPTFDPTTPDWLSWTAGTKSLTATANSGTTERTNTVTFTYTDGDLGVYTGTVIITQAAAQLVTDAASNTVSIASKAAGSSSAVVKFYLNTVATANEVTDDVEVVIPAALDWLQWDNVNKKFVAVTLNDTGSARPSTSTLVTVKYNGLELNLTVTQAGD